MLFRSAGPDLRNELFVARFTQVPNGFWHVSSDCQRAGLLSSRQASKQLNSIGRSSGSVKLPERLFSTGFQASPPVVANDIPQPNYIGCQLPARAEDRRCPATATSLFSPHSAADSRGGWSRRQHMKPLCCSRQQKHHPEQRFKFKIKSRPFADGRRIRFSTIQTKSCVCKTNVDFVGCQETQYWDNQSQGS